MWGEHCLPNYLEAQDTRPTVVANIVSSKSSLATKPLPFYFTKYVFTSDYVEVRQPDSVVSVMAFPRAPSTSGNDVHEDLWQIPAREEPEEHRISYWKIVGLHMHAVSERVHGLLAA